MNVKLTIKNYRCFPDSRPAELELREGFTALIGSNNSGKSSLLRFFYEFRNLFQLLSTVNNNFIEAVRGGSQAFSVPGSIGDINELFNDGNDRPITIDLTLPSVGEGILGRVQVTVPRGSNNWTVTTPGIDLGPRDTIGFGQDQLTFPAGTLHLAMFFDACQALSDTLYIGPFRNAINIGSNEAYFDIKVGQSFITQWRQYKTGPNKALNVAAFDLTDQVRRIFGFGGLEINPDPGDQTLQVFIDGRSYRLPELGAGLTQFFLVLANAAARKPAFILIDEPELNLHPSLQLDFLTTLASYATRGVLFGSHSVGLARAAAERIYSVRRIQQGESEVTPYVATPRLAEFLGKLSFGGYKELGFEQILLVEGPTDVKTMQQFLRLYGKEHQIVLLPLGGRDTVNAKAEEQHREIKRITDKVAAVVDSERLAAGAPLEARLQGFRQACVNATVACHVLDKRATENYLVDRAVQQVKGPKYRALSDFEKLDQMTPNWSKGENWRIARAMTQQEIANTDLGL